MTIWIAFLRGVNVGGATIVPMKALAESLADAGLADVATYIQSGNVVFRSGARTPAALERRIRDAITGRFSIDPAVLVLSVDALAEAIEANPFARAESEPRSLHLFFLAAIPRTPDLDGLEALKADSESFALVGKVFYLHAPDGFGRSRLAAQVARRLRVDATARNWRTAGKVLEMARALG